MPNKTPYPAHPTLNLQISKFQKAKPPADGSRTSQIRGDGSLLSEEMGRCSLSGDLAPCLALEESLEKEDK